VWLLLGALTVVRFEGGRSVNPSLAAVTSLQALSPFKWARCELVVPFGRLGWVLTRSGSVAIDGSSIA
jgi:hypothetical protein